MQSEDVMEQLTRLQHGDDTKRNYISNLFTYKNCKKKLMIWGCDLCQKTASIIGLSLSISCSTGPFLKLS